MSASIWAMARYPVSVTVRVSESERNDWGEWWMVVKCGVNNSSYKWYKWWLMINHVPVDLESSVNNILWPQLSSVQLVPCLWDRELSESNQGAQCSGEASSKERCGFTSWSIHSFWIHISCIYFMYLSCNLFHVLLYCFVVSKMCQM